MQRVTNCTNSIQKLIVPNASNRSLATEITSAHPPRAEVQRTSLEVRFVPLSNFRLPLLRAT
jgi:hypothetical protein